MHPRWLQDPDFLRYVVVHIDVYFTLNTDQTSASTRWEAFKAYIRGQIISFTSFKSNQLRKMRAMDSKIRELEKEAFLDTSLEVNK